MVKGLKNIHRELGSWAWGCGGWLQVVDAATILVPERLEGNFQGKPLFKQQRDNLDN